MTEEQAGLIIELLEKMIEYIDTFHIVYVVELFNLVAVLMLFIVSILTGIFILKLGGR